MLTESQFAPFVKQPNNEVEPEYLRTTGDCLKLRASGKARQHAFESEVVEPALVPLLQHADWTAFSDTLKHAAVDEQKLAAWLRLHDGWRRGADIRKSVRQVWRDVQAAFET